MLEKKKKGSHHDKESSMSRGRAKVQWRALVWWRTLGSESSAPSLSSFPLLLITGILFCFVLFLALALKPRRK